MQFKEPKNTEKYYWTKHIQMKMRQYGISEARVRRILRAPLRVETGIAEETIAVMQPVSTRWDAQAQKKTWKHELWLMYTMAIAKKQSTESSGDNDKMTQFINKQNIAKQIRFISVWRYPGVTKPGEGLPEMILDEIAEVM